MLAYVSAGRVDAYFERHMWPWDAVAGLALIRAAGGDHLPYSRAAPGAGGLVLAGGPELVRKTSAIVAGPRAN
jgi:myo-inositol-1(or 4)-monophosphatase